MPQQSAYARMARLSIIITVLPASMAAGWILGYFVVDKLLGTFPWGTVLAILLGAGGGFYEIIRILSMDQRDNSD